MLPPKSLPLLLLLSSFVSAQQGTTTYPVPDPNFPSVGSFQPVVSTTIGQTTTITSCQDPTLNGSSTNSFTTQEAIYPPFWGGFGRYPQNGGGPPVLLSSPTVNQILTLVNGASQAQGGPYTGSTMEGTYPAIINSGPGYLAKYTLTVSGQTIVEEYLLNAQRIDSLSTLNDIYDFISTYDIVAETQTYTLNFILKVVGTNPNHPGCVYTTNVQEAGTGCANYSSNSNKPSCSGPSPSCADLINHALHVQTNRAGTTADRPNICATFTPNLGYSLEAAARICHFKNFDWVQSVATAFNPQPFCARNLDGAFDPKAEFNPDSYCEQLGWFDSSLSAPVRLTRRRTPYSDPPPGGGYVDDTNYVQPDYGYPFYYDVNSDLASQEQGPEVACTLPVSKPGYTLTFHDAPGDPCIGTTESTGTFLCDKTSQPRGSYSGFITSLAGVTYAPPRTAAAAKRLGISFSWFSTYNGTSGGSYTIKTKFPADGNGTGGITVTSVSDITSLSDSGGGSPLTLLTGTQISPVASGLAYSRVSKTYNGTLTIKNTSPDEIGGPFQIVFSFLPEGVSLANATGVFEGSFYLTVPTVSSLAPGQSATVSVRFTNPSNATINFVPITYSGSID